MDSSQKKRVRLSKNKKKNWKKCDIQDVEDFLEEKRFDERIGGAVSDRKDKELFYLHTDATNEVRSKQPKKLKCFGSIGVFSKVPPPIKQKLEPYSKRIKRQLDLSEERKKKRFAKNLPSAGKEKENKLQQRGDLFSGHIKDIWCDEEKPKIDPEMKDIVTFRDEYTCKRTPKVPGHLYQKPSLLPAVEVPHGGASYNPAYVHHQELLLEAVKIEEKKVREELHLKRVLDDMFPTKDQAPTEETRLAEMSQGLFEEGEESENERAAGSNVFSRNPPVSAENRVPKSKKRRKKEMKELERLKALEKRDRKRQNDIYRLRSLKCEVKECERKAQLTAERNLKRKIEKMYQPKTLSKHKYVAPDLEVNLSEELSASLRTLKTEGNLLEDRYKSLQRRNLIEPREKTKFKRKYKLKRQVKRSHRNFK